jgi:hypothetical protein
MAIRINGSTPGATRPAPGTGALARSGDGPRLLVPIDFSVQPYSLGDLVAYLMGSLVVALERGCARVDVAIASDPGVPPNDPVMAAYATRDSHLRRLLALLPLLELHPLLGAVHVFTSRRELLDLLSDRAAACALWPSRPEIDARKYMYYDAIQAVHGFHERRGSIPQLRVSADLRRWAQAFFARLEPGRVPVTVNLRNNKGFHAHRNSNLEAWTEFLRVVAADRPVSFFVTGSPDEMDPGIRALPHVVYTKDHHTDTLQDLALIAEAAFHLGASSGPATIPLYGRRPYYIVNADVLPHLRLYGGALVQVASGELRFGFAGPLQTFGVVPETAALLRAQFERIWGSRDWPREHGV